ncbi:MAG: YggT family protein [Spirochaetaceae bacterium]|nr:YggT family protein [Spirochaetaceae bacterium]
MALLKWSVSVGVLFSILATCIGIYSILCFLAILFTWVPSPSTQFSRFLKSVCEPFFNLFRFPFTRIGNIDLSGVLALLALSLLQQFFNLLAKQPGDFSIFALFGILISAILSILSSILLFLFILILIRLLCECISSLKYSAFCRYFDLTFSFGYRFVEHTTNITNRIPVLVILAACVFIMRIILGILNIFI